MRACSAAKAVFFAAAGTAGGSRRRRMIATASPVKLSASVDMSYDNRTPSEEEPGALSKRVEGKASSKLDVGPILTTSRKLNERALQATEECPEGFIFCQSGQAFDESGNSLGSNCEDACNGNCCTGGGACDFFTGKVCEDGSCSGFFSCYDASTDVIRGCKGDRACYNASPTKIVDSCEGDSSCKDMAATGNAGIITGSCNDEQACYNLGAFGDVSDVTNGCNGSYACYSLGLFSFAGSITNSCNNVDACRSFQLPESEVSDLNNCCNNASECDEIFNGVNIPAECAAVPPGPNPSKLGDLEADAAALAFSECDVTFSTDDAQVECTFASPEGVDATAQILEGTCSSNSDFNIVSSSPVTTASTVIANLSFTDSITLEEKNSGTFAKQFCARADVFADNNGSAVSIGVQKVDVVVTLTYSSTGSFTVTGTNVTPVAIVDTSATATREAQISAALGPCGGTSKASYAVGERLEICIESQDSNAEIDAIKSVLVVDPSTQLVDENGVANALTVIGSLPATDVTLATLVIADYDDSGSGSITISGTADVNFVSRRMLNDIRVLQQDLASASFDLVVPISRPDVPNVSHTSENNAWAKHYGISAAMLTLGVVGVF